MIQSMTGFGRAQGMIGDRFSIVITAKSVNHKYLEVSIRLPEAFWELEPVVRAIAAENFSRGKLDIAVRSQRVSDPEYSIRVNARVAKAVIPQIRSMMEEQGIPGTFSAGDLLRIPDLLQVEAIDGEFDDQGRSDFRSILQKSFDGVRNMRETEGKALRDDIAARLDFVSQKREWLEGEREAITRAALDTFRERVHEIASLVGATVEENRLAEEVVLMVEKSDIAEELTRLQIHVTEAGKLLDSKQATGKKLDFLAQEILREINTLGQKSRSAAIRSVVVELKTEVERIREQVQNVE